MTQLRLYLPVLLSMSCLTASAHAVAASGAQPYPEEFDGIVSTRKSLDMTGPAASRMR